MMSTRLLRRALVAALLGLPQVILKAQPAVVDPALRQQASQALLPVLILLKYQPQGEIMARIEGGSRLRVQLLESRLREAGSRNDNDRRGLDALHAEYSAETLRVRRAAFREAELAITPGQNALAAKLNRLGASNVQRFTGANMIAAWIPATALPELESDPAIAEIAMQRMETVDLVTSVPATGAATLWNLGFRGGSESVAVIDTGIRAGHPAFRGLNVSPYYSLTNGKSTPCFGDDATSALDRHSHGTHVNGIVAGQGFTGFANHFGVARGIGELISIKAGFLTKPVAGVCEAGQGSFITADWLAGIEFIAKQTSTKVINMSLGGGTDADDDLASRMVDFYADTYGISIVIAAGNSGPNAYTVGRPGIAYNAITVANADTRGTAAKNDDVIANSSSRGPTIGLRNKPDITAPGSAIMAANLNADNLVAKTGTSMAAPHVAGALALLRDSGIKDPLALKALLINSADPPSTWLATWGWGFMNLTSAQAQRNNTVRDSIAPATQKFYSGSGSAVRASLVWNRRIAVNPQDRPRDNAPLNNLDLVLYNRRDNTALARSASRVNNVEVVLSTTPGDYLIKVQAPETAFTGGQGDEPFALAITAAGFTEVQPPAPEISCSAPASVGAGASFTLSCTATNRGGLPLFRLTGTPQVPSGFTGATAQTFSALAPGQSQTLTWNLRAGNTGGGSVSVRATGNAFDDIYTVDSNIVDLQTGSTPGINLTLSQTSLSFAQQTGGALTGAQTVAITASNGNPAVAASVATANGGQWLTASLSSGNAPSTLTIRPATAATSLASGSYSGTVTITSAGATNSPLVIAVRLEVTPQASTNITIENPRISRAVELVNGCPVPAATTQINASDARVFFWFIARGARTGDAPAVEWIRPDGSVYERVNLWNPTANGSYCYAPALTISQIPNEVRTGNWRARLLWNGQQAASVDFTFLVPPTIISAVLAGTKDDPGSCDLEGRTNYRTTDEVVKACFMAETARRGDTFGIRYTRPDGTRHGQFIADALTEDTPGYYLWSWYAIKGFPVAGYTGEWKVDFLWNGSSIRTLTFVLNPPVSVEGIRVTSKNPEALGCDDPGETAYFLPRDATATLWFTVSGALAGDRVTANFVKPDGSVFGSVEWDPLEEDGNWCFWTWIDVKDDEPGKTFGNWSANVNWNDAKVIDQPFKILPVDLTGLMVTRATVTGALCTAPVPNTEFLTTDPVARLWFTIDLANTGDVASIEWVDPRGNVAFRTAFQPLSDGGAWCLASSLPIAGQNRPTGAWTAKALWNGVEVGSAGLTISTPGGSENLGVPTFASAETKPAAIPENQGDSERAEGSTVTAAAGTVQQDRSAADAGVRSRTGHRAGIARGAPASRSRATRTTRPVSSTASGEGSGQRRK